MCACVFVYVRVFDLCVVQYGVRPTPPDVDIRVCIPAVLILNRHTSQLQVRGRVKFTMENTRKYLLAFARL